MTNSKCSHDSHHVIYCLLVVILWVNTAHLIFYLICNFCTKQPSCSPGADGPSIHILGVRPHKMCQMLRTIPRHKCPSNKETDVFFRVYVTWRWGDQCFHNFSELELQGPPCLALWGVGGGGVGGLEACSPRKVLRWLTKVFYGLYLPSLSINCVAINKDLEK